jgi:predicted SnoaL-like aldol condensation-catalyzing enzyme
MRYSNLVLPGVMLASFANAPHASANDLALTTLQHSPAHHNAPSVSSSRSQERSAEMALPVDLERNKALVIELFDIIYGTSLEDIAKIDGIVAEDYIQHNPSVGPGREGLRGLLKMVVPEPKALNPADTISVHYIAEGDRVVRQEMRKNGMLIDIFRIKDGKLQEHWDAFRFNPGAERIPGF